MKLLISILLLVSSVAAIKLLDVFKEEWNAYKLEHSKDYESETVERFRMKIYLENKNKIYLHNQKFQKGLVKYRLDQNKYGDLLHHEFVATLNGFNRTRVATVKKERGATFISPANVEVPSTVDWRTKGAVTAVKDQGKCGSCWSFSATGALEGQHFRKSGVLISLSEQNLIDCSSAYGNNGCNGGLMDNAFQYIKDNHGVDTERTYPYEAIDDKCRYNPKNSGADDVGFVDIPSGNEEKLKEAIAIHGPVSVAIDASQMSFQFYRDGVYYDENCSNSSLDHGVLAVGYGTTEDGDDYWLIKNSWGRTWGDEGYIKIARNKDNHCGVASSASYPLV